MELEWIELLLKRCDRQRSEVSFNPHAILRQGQRNIEPRFMELAVRRGKLVRRKCNPPRKLCLEYYDGKKRITYGVYVLVQDSYFEVMTGWKRIGK